MLPDGFDMSRRDPGEDVPGRLAGASRTQAPWPEERTVRLPPPGHTLLSVESPVPVAVEAPRLLPSLLQALSWPVTQWSLDGAYLHEAPSPARFAIPPGRHVFTFVRTDGLGGLTFAAQLDPGAQYVIKADLESSQGWMERVP
jgi:hypothetical protein